jgi:hypothetical protein
VQNGAVKVEAELTLFENERQFKLPGSGSPSMLFRFHEAKGAPTFGAWAIATDGRDFEPGERSLMVTLDFRADAAAREVVRVGSRFTVWYGSDVGRGQVRSLLT